MSRIMDRKGRGIAVWSGFSVVRRVVTGGFAMRSPGAGASRAAAGRRARRLIAAGIAATLIASPAVAGLEGKYVVRGQNPGGESAYKGKAIVKQQGSVYQVVWKVGQRGYVGTGIRRGEVFSVVYRTPRKNSRAGLVVYQIEDNGKLIGLWVQLGGKRVGIERWRPAGNGA